MDMAKHRTFLNFAVPDDLVEMIDETAEKSGLDRSKQARALIEYALGYVRKPYIPAAEQPAQLSFSRPQYGPPSQKSRRRR